MKSKSLKKNLIIFVISIILIPILFLLVLGIPEKEPKSLLLSLTSISILIAIVIVIISTIFLAYVDKIIIKPIYNLLDNFKKLSKGEYDLYIENDRVDEIGELLDNFNKMVASLKSYRERENKAKEEREELISSISHDLSTPLSVIQAHIDGISDGVADSEEKKDEYIRIINKNIKQLNNRIKQLKDYSSFGIYDKEINNIRARESLDRIVDELNRSFTIEIENLFYKNYIKENTVIGLSDRMLEIILENLFSNSIKYRSENPLEIDIIAKENSDTVIVEFKDNGKGIEKSELDKIFNPLYTVDKARTTDKESMGLGLSIVKKILNNVGGDIGATSELGQYIVFFIEIPIAFKIEMGVK
ncbi:MAG: HAMP domain-containing sensor histidine kinase [Anaerococcus vaginalis]|nr:HAMP domain-containing sensor histidine kinase [Anaerococcus vaginalis]